jgi:hypothetical protein
VSVRERRNRKDRRAKTPEQLRRQLAKYPLGRLGTWMPVGGPLPGADPSGFKQA